MRVARSAAGAVLAGALAVCVTVVGSGTATAATAPGSVSWSPALDGEAVGVDVAPGTVRLSPDRASAAGPALRLDGHGDTRPPGLLTLPARTLDVPVDRVDASVEVSGDGGTAVGVDVRGLRPGGRWTEWLPAETVVRTPTTAGRRALEVALPVPVTRVQARLVLTPPGTGARGTPEIRALTLTAHPATGAVRAEGEQEPRHHEVFATREGLVGGTTANGHVVTERDLFVALPSRRALSPRDTSDYSVKVCAPTGRCAFAPVWDVGPWNTRDDYWNPSDRRQNWNDLPQGMPQAQAAKTRGHNGGKDQFGRTVVNPAGIDLADGLFWDALELKDNAWVTVDYLWTGDSPLGTVRVDRRVDLRSAPDPTAEIVGLVADHAAVPLQCRTDEWLRIGVGQFLPIASVPGTRWAAHLRPCPATDG